MQDIIYVVAKLQARAGKEEALRRLLEPLLERTRKEPGCRRYALMQDCQNPAVLTLLEEWDTDADLNTHLALPHIQKTLAEVPELLGAPPEIARYKQIG
jgi:quinol monooxygenase YgiN